MSNLLPVLVVDDDQAILDLLHLALEDEGYEVLLAHDGAEALALLQSVTPGLILLDLRMPKVNGWEFAQAYRSGFSCPAPIVVMSAKADTEDTPMGVEAEGYLSKPFDLDDLVTVVRRHARTGTGLTDSTLLPQR